MTQTRTELDALTATPVVVKLGGKDFSIAPQPRGRAAKWLKEYLSLIPQRDESWIDKPEIHEGINELFYSYDPELAKSRKWIDEHATQEEFADAFAEMIALTQGPFVLMSGRIARAMAGGAQKLKDDLTSISANQ